MKVLGDGTYGFSSLSAKIRKSNRFQISWQRQHFVSHLKTLSVDLAAEFEPAISLLKKIIVEPFPCDTSM